MHRPIALFCVVISFASAGPAEASAAGTAIIHEPQAGGIERLAAQELRRYIYVRTGSLLPLCTSTDQAPVGDWLVVGAKTSGLIEQSLSTPEQEQLQKLGPQQYLLRTIERDGHRIAIVAGGDPIGALYGAYRFAEHMGVRFYLHGDVVPDEQIPLVLPDLNDLGTPLFKQRGIQPFHDFPEGPDWWDADDYKAIFAQLPKLRMNFFGLHTYPEGGVGPEPTVWIGPPGEVGEEGKVTASYPSRHFVTSNVTAAWGYQPRKTSSYAFGAAALFERDDYGANYMQGTHPWNEMDQEKSNALFNRVGLLLKDSFTFARRLGIQTCVGSETPLILPQLVRERLAAAGKSPADPQTVQHVYEGMFRRIMAAYPIDYYWLWTPENWTWEEVKQEQIEATLADFRAAEQAVQAVGAPFQLATCGWVLGPPQKPALFDSVLPKSWPLSCINRNVGHDPVEPGFATIVARPRWAIPWLEDDPAMIIPQLWVGRMRKDAADALHYGCDGLLGIHWRTRILGPNVAALAQASWSQESWNSAGAEQAPPTLDGSFEQRRLQYPAGARRPAATFTWTGPWRNLAVAPGNGSGRSLPNWTALCHVPRIGSMDPGESSPIPGPGVW